MELFAELDPAAVEFWTILKVRSPHHGIPIRIGNGSQQFGKRLSVKLENPVFLLPLLPSAARIAPARVRV